LLPSIQNSTDDAVPPLTLAVQLIVPDSCWPVTTLDVTVKAVVAARAGAIPRVSVVAISATRMIRSAERQKAREREGLLSAGGRGRWP